MKFVSRKGIVTELIIALPDNGSVKTLQRATVEAASQWTNVVACRAPMD
jgi:hypothetical protein